MALVESKGFAHVRLTVTDIKRSKEFYDRVFGWEVAFDESDKAGEPGIKESQEDLYGGVGYQLPQGTIFGLRPVSQDSFDPDRTGLDHLSFQVESVEELHAIAKRLDEAGIEHGEVTDVDIMTILSIQDPDDINLELAVPKE